MGDHDQILHHIMAGRAFVVAKEIFHHRNGNILNSENDSIMKNSSFRLNSITHLYLENNYFTHLKMRLPDLCNFLTERVFGAPIKHACRC